MTSSDLQALFERQRAARWRVAGTSVAQRQARLRALLDALMARQAEARAALAEDFRKPPEEVDLTEVYPVVTEVREALRHLPRWARPRRVPTPLGFLGTRAEVRPEPLGNALVISPWNYPLQLALGPLVSAVAAGNCVILKPSEYTPATTAFLRRFLADLFPEEEVALVEGEADTARALLDLPFDHVFFTGSPAVGREVMKAAAAHLASVTLELGGKSPVLVDADADLARAARRIAWGKGVNAGQTCVAPDFVLVHERVHDALVEALKAAFQGFYGATPEARKASPDLARIITDRHHARLTGLLRDSRGLVVFGGEQDPGSRYLSPTLVTGVDPASPLMQEEIFGPILPILKVPDLAEAVAFVNARPKPLALYVFTRSATTADRVLSTTTAGGSCVNDTVVQFAHPHLPFGGAGASGFGKAHGEAGFLAFSNLRGVLHQRSPFPALQLMHPPYTGFVRRMIELTLRHF